MLPKQIGDVLFVNALLSFFYFPIITYSFKYHAAKYEISQEAVDYFWRNMIAPIRFFFRLNLRNVYFNRPEHTTEQWMRHWMTKRVLASILPSAFICVAVFDLLRTFFRPNPYFFRSLGILLSVTLFLVLSWRFGSGLKNIEASEETGVA